jgi:hypothetical protein
VDRAVVEVSVVHPTERHESGRLKAGKDAVPELGMSLDAVTRIKVAAEQVMQREFGVNEHALRRGIAVQCFKVRSKSCCNPNARPPDNS